MKLSKYPLAQDPQLPFAHELSVALACAYSWLKLTYEVRASRD